MSGRPLPKVWTCRRQRDGEKCRMVNYAAQQKCQKCGGAKPPKREPKHRAVLNSLTYEQFVEINGGERCGICLREPRVDGRRFARDHDHRTGRARGILCFRCNSALHYWMTSAWMRAAAEYLERAA